jgi:sigma-B regulation protein RsbU (phosphoserine phosphatase)
MKILIAEDDITSRSLLKVLLTKRGHEVVATENGAEAWQAMQRSDAPRLAILDWIMPEMDGLDVCRHIRGLETDRPPYIIVLTTKGEKADIVAGLEAGANDYLPKPYDPGELHARIDVGRRLIEMQTILAGKIEELRDALDHIKTLQGILPICSFCKKIRDDQGYWTQVESYISKHTDAQFSHGICPECVKQHYPEFAKNSEGGKA